MAVFSINFSGETTGAAPANFTSRWTTTGETWAVREKAGTLSGKSLELVSTTNARRLYSWDTPGTAADVELLCRFRASVNGSDMLRLYARAAGSAGSETGYFLNVPLNASQVTISRYVAGLSTNVALFNYNWLPNVWYWARFRVEGTSLKAKIWIGDHTQEPAAWNVETTDSGIAAAGWIGIGAFTAGTRDFDDLAVGTAGDTAAFPTSEDVRVTQAPVLALTTADSSARITQAAALVLGELVDSAPARITQATALALAEYDASILVTQTVALALVDHVPCLTRWAQCWTITRTDGTVLGFTSLDRPVTFRGVVHQPCGSLMASAVELSTVVGSTGSMELRGILSSAGVSESDIYNGLYDNAVIEAWLVPWENTTGQTPIRLMGGVTGASGHGITEFSQELLTDAARLQQRALLETYSPGCRYQFGNSVDPRCPVDLSLLTVAGTVTALAIPNASTSATRRIFTDSSRAEADGYFNLGRVTWTSGPNAGAVSEVKDFTGGQFILWEALLHPIGLGDAYEATPGCDKSPAAHLTFNADMVDFGGFPHVPGNDNLLQTPDAKG